MPQRQVTAPPVPQPPVGWPGAPVPPPGFAAPRHGRALWPVLAAVVALALVGGVVTAVWLASRNGGGTHSVGTTANGATSEGGAAAPASAGPSAQAQATGGTVPDRDDFSGATVNTAIWGVYHSTGKNGSVWATDAVQVVDGELQIIGTGRNPTGAGNTAGGLCWCGKGGNQLYGKWQVRARFDAGAGYAPLVGLWPQTNHQTDGSIVFAGPREADRHTMHGNVTWSTDHLQISNGKLTGDFTAWHTYTVEWRAAFVKMYVDDKLYYDSTTSATPVVVPKVPMHLIVQVTVGPVDGVPGADASTPDHVVTHLDWASMSG
jgi:beta-glucanase (GH16 family)